MTSKNDIVEAARKVIADADYQMKHYRFALAQMNPPLRVLYDLVKCWEAERAAQETKP